MGIKDFSRFLERYARSATKQISLKESRGKTWAIDANIFMYRFMAASPQTENRHLVRFERFVSWLKKNKIEGIFVFDGESPEQKKEELQNRRQNKKQATNDVKELHQGVAVIHHLQWRWEQIESILRSVSMVSSPVLGVKTNYLPKEKNIPLSGLYQLVAELLEWGTETYLPSGIIQNLFDKSFLVKDTFPRSVLPYLIRFCAQIRLRRHTPHMIELDWMHEPVYSIVSESLQSCNCATASSCQGMTLEVLETLLTDSLTQNEREIPRKTFGPFIVCVHCTFPVLQQIAPVIEKFRQEIDDAWSIKKENNTFGYMMALVVHESTEKEGMWVLPSSSQAKMALKRWQEDIPWPTKCQEKAAHSANFDYYEWISSAPSSEWWFAMRDFVVPLKNNFERRPCVYDCDLFTCASARITNAGPDISTSKAAEARARKTPNLDKEWEHLHNTPSSRAPDKKKPKIRPEKQHLECLDRPEAVSASWKHENILVDKMNEKIALLEPQIVRVTATQVEEVKKMLQEMGAKIIVAEHEAEATCARLCRAGLADWVVTEDFDAIPFGSPLMLRSFIWKSVVVYDNTYVANDSQIIGELISLDRILLQTRFHVQELVDLCILCGCDFCPPVKEMDLTKAYDLVCRYQSLENIIKNADPGTRTGQNFEGFSLKSAVDARKLFLENHTSVLPECVCAQLHL